MGREYEKQCEKRSGSNLFWNENVVANIGKDVIIVADLIKKNSDQDPLPDLDQNRAVRPKPIENKK